MQIARPVLLRMAGLVLLLTLIVVAIPRALGQDAPSADTDLFPVVDIHRGTCDDPVGEPAYDAGQLEPQSMDSVDAIAETADRFLSSDVDGNGTPDAGVDADGDGSLSEDEVIISDVEVAPAVWSTTTLRIDATIEQFQADPYVVVAHRAAEDYDTYLACGEISGDGEPLVLMLRPFNDSGFFGYSVIEPILGATPTVAENESEITTYLFQAPSAASTPVPATPRATNTPVPISTNTPEPAPTFTPVPVPTNTPVTLPTNTPVPVPTNTPVTVPTNTPAPVPTNTPVPAPTNTPVPVQPATPEPVATNTPVPVQPATPEPVPTNTPVPVQPATPEPVATNTPVPVTPATPVPVATNTPVPAPTNTPVTLPTNTPVPVPTNTPVTLPTNTPVPAPTNTPVTLPTNTPVPVPTNTPVTLPTNTPVPVPTNTPDPAPTNTPVPATPATPVPVVTNTPVPAEEATPAPVQTNTPVPAPTFTPVPAPTNTPVPLPTLTPTPIPTNTPEPRPTFTPVPISTNTPEPVATNTPVPVPTNTPVTVPTNTPEPAPTNTPVPATPATPIPVPTNTPVPVPTNTPVPVPTNTPEPVPTNTPEPAPTNTPVPATPATPVPVATNTPVPAATNTPEPAPTNTPVTAPTNTPVPIAVDDAELQPVSDIHAGTCEQPVGEPAYDAGQFEAQSAADMAALQEAADRFLSADVDGNGTADAGIDLNGDGSLTEDEVMVSDADVDTAYWSTTALRVDATLEQLRSDPHIVIVHRAADDYDTYLACGEITGDGDPLVVPLNPVDDSGFFGYSLIEPELGGTPTVAENPSEITSYLFQAPTTEAAPDNQTPPADDQPADAAQLSGPVPAMLTAGTCDNVGDSVADLPEIGEPSEIVGPDGAIAVRTASTTLDLTLDQILEQDHTLSLQNSDGETIACGAVGGVRTGDDLVFGLQQQNDSGFAGTGWLRASGEQTRLLMYVFPLQGGGGEPGEFQDVAFPAGVYGGGCDNPEGEVAALASAAYARVAQTEVTAEDLVGPDSALPVLTSVTSIDQSLDDLIGQPHAITVLESGDNPVVVACGAIGGNRVDNNLYLGLAGQGDSNLSGLAWVSTNDQGQSVVTIFLVRGLAG